MRIDLHRTAILAVALSAGALAVHSEPDLARQIADVMAQGPSGKAHQRFAHPKGIVCQGAFEATPAAKALSRAAHWNGNSVPVTVRFSNAAPDVTVPDNSADASPRGIAIRFGTGRGTDILAISHNGFVVGTGEDFLAFQLAIAATDPSKPHPWPIESFLGSHPLAKKFVEEVRRVPAGFATESYFANNAFVFVNEQGQKRTGRYQILPEAGNQYIDNDQLKDLGPDFLSQELRTRLAKGPARFRLYVQLAAAGDQTTDSSLVWPADRERIEIGLLTITAVVPDSVAAENKLAFDPTRLVDGIELSDDPLPLLRSRVYAFSVAGRHTK